MNKKLIRIRAVLIMVLTLTISFVINAKDSDSMPQYEITGAGTGTQGVYLVYVSVVSKKNNPSDNLLKQAAVHGVLFRGFSNKEHRQMQKPLAGSAANEAQHADFYKDFFSESGNAANYATIIDGSRKVVKSGKEYRITVTASVNKDALRSYLESMGILTGLNTGF